MPHRSEWLPPWVWLLLLAALALRLWLASALALFGDEAFYWLESRHPDWGYSDVPLLTPLLVGLGTQLIGDSYLGVRLLFVVIGSAIPLAVWWLALPLTGHRHAVHSLLAATALPLLASLGILALPDVPLVLLSVLSLGMAVRVIRQPSRSRWLWLGLLLGLGLLAHYRFVLLPAALLLASLTQRDMRRLWLTPGPWLALAIALLGLLPALWFNLHNGLAAFAFHFSQRHPWQFQADGLWHPLAQAATVSPLLYLLLLASFLPLWQQSRAGQPAAHLLLVTAALYLGLFALLAPWTDQRSTNIHWPLTGYLPLLVYLPVWLAQRQAHWGTALTRRLRATALGCGWCFVGLGILWCIGITRLEQLSYPLSLRVTDNMAGWSAIAERVRAQPHAPLLADNYYLAGQLAFELQRTDGLFTLDDDKIHRDGRARQLQLWGWRLQDAQDAQADWPATGLAVLERNHRALEDWQDLLTRLCARYPGLRQVDSLDQFHGSRQILFARLDTQPTADPDPLCRPPVTGWLDVLPKAGQTVSGTVTLAGWYSHPDGIARVFLRIDGQTVANARYGLSRPDVLRQLGALRDANLPQVGFRMEWDSRQHPDGWHRLQLVTETRAGHSQVAQDLWVHIRQPLH